MRTKILTYYTEVSKGEGINLFPVKFCRVGKGGAMVVYNSMTKTPLNVCFDLSHLCDPEFAVLHEIAHIVLLSKSGNAGHGAKFTKEFNRLVDKYTYSNLCMQIFAGKN